MQEVEKPKLNLILKEKFYNSKQPKIRKCLVLQ
jgi:hypothetical protein